MKKLLTYGFNEVFCKGLNVGLILILPLLLPKDQFGVVVYFIAIEQVIVSIIAFGQHNYFLKRYQKSSNIDEKEIVFIKLRSVCKSIALLSFTVVFLLNTTTSYLHYDLVYYLLLIFASYFIAIYEMSNIKYRADGDDFLYFRSKLTYQVIKFSSCLLVIFLFDVGFESYLIAILLSSVVTHAINISLKLKWNRLFSKPNKKEFIILLPFASQSILNILYSVLDRIMVKDLLNNEKLAVYGFSYNIASLAFFVISVIFLVYLPRFYKIKDLEVAKEYLKNGCLISSCLIIVFMFVVYIGYDLLGFLYDDVYTSSSVTTLILVSSYLCHILYLYYFHINNFLDNMKGLPIIVLFTLFVNATLNYFMIPEFGIEGAAVSTLISECLLGVLMGVNFKVVKYHGT
ncbi:polysaccharide biosynthesis C-terminal domain-containing protein [Vibrio splendidus]